jgi:hypothetical protein
MRRITLIILLLLAAFLVTQAAFSLRWPIAHDEAPLFYEAFLMQSEGRIPYRDIFDFQMPGSYIAYYALGLVSGFDPFRIRILDLLILAALIFITFQAMRRFGSTPALAAGILFGLKYLQGGPSLSLQREYLLLVFIALSLLIGMRDTLTPKHRLSLGILFGLSAVIKPHAALGLLPFLLFDIADIRQRPNMTLPKAAWTSILPAAIGFAIPVSLVIAWLALTGALTPFLTIALNYWPLYSQINGQMEITPTAERISFLLNQIWRLGGSGLWLIPAAFGIYLNRNRQTYLLASLALCYAIYPALSGQFFPYHYIPFIYIIILVASLSLTTHHFPLSTSFILPLSSLILLLFLIRPSTTFLRQIQGHPIATSTDRAEEIARFLEKISKQAKPSSHWIGQAARCLPCSKPVLQLPRRMSSIFIFIITFPIHTSNPCAWTLCINCNPHPRASSSKSLP